MEKEKKKHMGSRINETHLRWLSMISGKTGETNKKIIERLIEADYKRVCNAEVDKAKTEAVAKIETTTTEICKKILAAIFYATKDIRFQTSLVTNLITSINSLNTDDIKKMEHLAEADATELVVNRSIYFSENSLENILLNLDQHI